VDPDPFQEFAYPTRVAAKLAIVGYLALPLAKLPAEQLEAIESLLRSIVWSLVFLGGGFHGHEHRHWSAPFFKDSRLFGILHIFHNPYQVRNITNINRL